MSECKDCKHYFEMSGFCTKHNRLLPCSREACLTFVKTEEKLTMEFTVAEWAKITNLMTENEKLIADLAAAREALNRLSVTYYEAEASRVFVEHIRRHLESGQDVICKICGLTVQQIWANHCKETEQQQAFGL